MRNLIALLLLCACANNNLFNDFGAGYVGTRYMANPLGEGFGYDADPLIRYDAFDCTTFVETVLANGDTDKLTQLRYKNGIVDFLHRNHFIETDWLVNNSKYIQNISYTFPGASVRHVINDKQSWFKTVHNISTSVPPQSADLTYIPYSAVRKINNTRPMVVLFVVEKSNMVDKLGTDLAVVHMGILLPGGTVMRHASRLAGMVVDTDFAQYIQMRQRMPHNIGISLVEIK